jgi:hypothetical protein
MYMAVVVTRVWVAPRRRRRWLAKQAKPRGTRPAVHMVFEDVTYDVTDSLLDAGVQTYGKHLWVILGPEHIRMKPEQSGFWLRLQNPMPLDTLVEVPLTPVDDDEQQLRFMTVPEIRLKYPHAT